MVLQESYKRQVIKYKYKKLSENDSFFLYKINKNNSTL